MRKLQAWGKAAFVAAAKPAPGQMLFCALGRQRNWHWYSDSQPILRAAEPFPFENTSGQLLSSELLSKALITVPHGVAKSFHIKNYGGI